MRTAEEVAKQTKGLNLPFPIRSALFQDEGGIAEHFVPIFILGFDSNRAALAAHYYDEQSVFSFAVNIEHSFYSLTGYEPGIFCLHRARVSAGLGPT